MPGIIRKDIKGIDFFKRFAILKNSSFKNWMIEIMKEEMKKIEIKSPFIFPFKIHRRAADDIKAEIVAIASKDVSKTQVMYRCNLSFKQTRDYLRDLTNVGLLEIKESEERKWWITTEKGKEWLLVLQKLKAIENER